MQYLVNRYDLRINKAFGDRRSAPMVIIEAFRRLGYDDGATAEIYGQIRLSKCDMIVSTNQLLSNLCARQFI
ncbi:MAG: hypothetical protein EBW38_03960 [Rhodobacteraceae bacterium]|nr:hypothetical protein [Paracoccaceae bacterium]